MEVLIGYNDLFKENNKIELYSLLAELPINDVINRISYINSAIHLREYDINNQDSLLKFLIQKFNKTQQYHLLQSIDRIRKYYNIGVYFFTNIASLAFIKYALKYCNNNESDIFNNQQEYQFLLAYFMVNDIVTQKHNNILDNNDLKRAYSEIDKKLHSELLLNFSQNELLSSKYFIYELHKGFLFLKFLEQDDNFSQYIISFYKTHSVENKKEFIQIIANTYSSLINNTIDIKHGIRIPESLPHIYNIFKNLSFKEQSLNKKDFNDNEYKIFREYPVYELKDRTFIVLNFNFLIDKIYQNIQFQFFQHLNKYKSISFNNFKSEISYKFSEKILFNQIINSSVKTKRVKIISGNKFTDVEYSDFYIRDGNQIYLFEFKDTIVKSEIKNSYSITKIKDEINRMFYKDGNNDKGILQILKVIKNLQVITSKIDPSFKHNFCNIKIYPVIVFTDITLDTPGINFLLNQKLQDEKNKYTNLKVKNLTMINITTLYKFNSYFNNNRLNLLTNINEFTQKQKTNRLLTFDNFIKIMADNKNYNLEFPKVAEEDLKQIFE